MMGHCSGGHYGHTSAGLLRERVKGRYNLDSIDFQKVDCFLSDFGTVADGVCQLSHSVKNRVRQDRKNPSNRLLLLEPKKGPVEALDVIPKQNPG